MYLQAASSEYAGHCQEKEHNRSDAERRTGTDTMRHLRARKTNEMHIFPGKTQNPLQPSNKGALHLFHCQTEGPLKKSFNAREQRRV